jgi:DNA-binding transcriptional LysR family regulator
MGVFVENYDALFCMIEANVGIGLIPECAARRYARSGTIKIIPVSDAKAARDLSVCFRSFDDLPAFARDFLDVLVEVSGGPPIAWEQGPDSSAGARASAAR